MNEHLELIDRFYRALSRRDAESMIACYHAQSRFEDPVFGPLDHADAVAMWRMLCERGKDLRFVASGLYATDLEGGAHWEAKYTYGATGRRVINRGDAKFIFRDGQILHHVDEFDLYRWMRQALGITGALIGWSAFGRRVVRRRARGALARYRSRSKR